MNDSTRQSAAGMSGAEFRAIGHNLVDRIAELIDSIDELPVARPVSPRVLRPQLPAGGMPREGTEAGKLFREALTMLFENSTFNAHPRFFGYISGSPAPIGILADL